MDIPKGSRIMRALGPSVEAGLDLLNGQDQGASDRLELGPGEDKGGEREKGWGDRMLGLLSSTSPTKEAEGGNIGGYKIIGYNALNALYHCT